VPLPGVWKVIFNSDQGFYGGSDYPISGAVMTEEINWQGKAFSLSINLPPLSALVLKA
jgi:1,4-alpha-glucan branching enzyme